MYCGIGRSMLLSWGGFWSKDAVATYEGKAAWSGYEFAGTI